MSAAEKQQNQMPPQDHVHSPQKENSENDSPKKPTNPFLEHVPHKVIDERSDNKTDGNQNEEVRDSREVKRRSRDSFSSVSKSPEHKRERSRQKEYRGWNKHEGRNWRGHRDSESSHRNEHNFYNDHGYKRQSYQNRGRMDHQREPKDYRKTKLCPLFDKGLCKKGYDCNFAHGENQLKILPDYRKTKLCLAFKDGKCGRLSSQCKYAHGEAELRKLPDGHSFDRSSRQRKMERPPKKHYHDYDKYDYRPPAPNYSHSYQNPSGDPYGTNPQHPNPPPYYYYPPPMIRQPPNSHPPRNIPQNQYEPMYYPPPPPTVGNSNPNERGPMPPMTMPYPPPPMNSYEYYQAQQNYRYPPVYFFQAF